MKRIVRTIPVVCRGCGNPYVGSHRAYLSNPFCSDPDCLDKRLEASGAIDLRDNHTIKDLGNGYAKVEPIDPNKKWKAKSSTE